jgi:hypothetical protein
MPPTRPKLVLDEESFQGLLAAAYTIQQYNEREGGIDAALTAELNATLGATSSVAHAKAGVADAPPVTSASIAQAPAAVELCQQCGTPLPAAGIPCPACDAEDFRPGERLQRTWATMWTMSQEQASNAGQGTPAEHVEPAKSAAGDRSQAAKNPLGEGAPKAEDDLVFHPADEEALRILPTEAAETVPSSTRTRVTLRFRRADLYLGLAVIVALVALLWPTASAGRSGLRPWERVLIAMGIAEAPVPVDVHYTGDPNIKVWVDTEAAMYYCPGDELYGKSSGGYYTTQREAQQDRFEPALRRACVP